MTDRLSPHGDKGPFKKSAGREPGKNSHISLAHALDVLHSLSMLRIDSEKLISQPWVKPPLASLSIPKARR